MLDTTTYLLTQDNPGGPIVRQAEPMPHEIYSDGIGDHRLTGDRLIAGIISLVLLVGAGAYLFLAV